MSDANTATDSESVAPPTKEEIILELQKAPIEEVISELAQWRAVSVNVLLCMNQLSEFKMFAKDGEELTEKIKQLQESYKAALMLKDSQIDTLMGMIQAYQNDPIGIGHKLDKLSKIALKSKIN
jgi:DNA-binding NtrC family response regulator